MAADHHNYNSYLRGIWCLNKFLGSPSNRHLTKKHKCELHGGISGKFTIHLLGPWISVQNWNCITIWLHRKWVTWKNKKENHGLSYASVSSPQTHRNTLIHKHCENAIHSVVVVLNQQICACARWTFALPDVMKPSEEKQGHLARYRYSFFLLALLWLDSTNEDYFSNKS